MVQHGRSESHFFGFLWLWQQQLAIGRALVIEPKLLILDEPGEGIQPNIVAQIGQVIRQLINEDGRPVAKGEISELSNELIKQHLTV